MGKKENIRLDARLKSVIGDAAFRAILANGHEIVAHAPRGMKARVAGALKAGDTVSVEMSPFDMSRGHIILEEES